MGLTLRRSKKRGRRERVGNDKGFVVHIRWGNPYADVKVFGGYYHYYQYFGLDDLNGFKGCLEIKATPSLYLNADVFDSKDLTGRDFYLGAISLYDMGAMDPAKPATSGSSSTIQLRAVLPQQVVTPTVEELQPVSLR